MVELVLATREGTRGGKENIENIPFYSMRMIALARMMEEEPEIHGRSNWNIAGAPISTITTHASNLLLDYQVKIISMYKHQTLK